MAVAVAISLGWMGLSRGGETAANTAVAPRVGFVAPDFTLPSPTGEEYTLSQWRGQAVVVNFWASWCAPCRVETPYFQELSEQYAGQVVIVGVNQGETAAVASQFVADYQLTYPVVLDQDNRISREYAIFGLPTTLFIDETGVVRHIIPGAVNKAVLESQIQQLLK